jgi:hypothetical protein
MHPSLQNRSGLLGDFKLHGVLSFLLHHDGPGRHMLPMSYVSYAQLG